VRTTGRPSSVRAAALQLLTRRDYTAAELRKKLAAREYDHEAIDQAMQRLVAEGLIDDRRVAAAHVRTAAGVKHRGRLRIRRELEERGVDRAVARELVSELSPEDEAAAIDRFLTRQRLPERPSPAERRRVFQQLLRRGFPADAIASALRRRGVQEDPT
jgi:regulatory protein